MDYTYSDLCGNLVSLTESEIAWFRKIVGECKIACNFNILIECANHDQYKGHTEALGIFHTDKPDSPFEGDSKITIDNYFIHECYEEIFNNGYNLTFESLEHVIAHEFAHAFQWRHCKRHSRLTEEFYNKIKEYQNGIEK